MHPGRKCTAHTCRESNAKTVSRSCKRPYQDRAATTGIRTSRFEGAGAQCAAERMPDQARQNRQNAYLLAVNRFF
ncbi:hypothetical protein NDU88_002914 [Pleurodeles waltl]|uniref:Uncharacterized protein n=1 Tax=Pleurodeles waltl TaxID=8319 RepID=A0AAV7RFC6_PLEWA|nr:hypothetical protein NDU88_002914 [Pleurodeles waltl]